MRLDDQREPSPELRIPGAAAQTRVVSLAGIRLDSRKSVRPFKGIICDDISEFESHMPSQAVGSPSPSISKRLKSREELFRTRGCGEGAAVDQMVTANVYIVPPFPWLT